MLPIVLNGPRGTLVSFTGHTRIGPVLRLRGTAECMAWATLSFDETLSITLIWPNTLLSALLNDSTGPGVTP
jgi:hypothetical protein